MDRQTKRKNLTFVKNAPFAGIGIMILLITGLVVDATKADGDSFYADIIRLDNVATKIHQNYVEEMPSKNLIDNAIKGMLETLDPHTSYFEAKQYEELKIHTEGKFGGLGIQISIRDKVLTVMTPIAGTPASRAGIQSGDQIIKIDGK
ncbi:MAG TPA: PDZ domain-containing protein, partial [Chitinispirillaceae bacterium]|nr:PDZ domain-containing protein [Chitinispirillaceae bacterium]